MENKKQLLEKHFRPITICFIGLIIISLLLPSISFGKSILWKSEHNGHTLYLMGSIHVLKQNNYPLAPAMEIAYRDSDVVAFEVDIAESESVATQQLFLQHGMFHNGQTLQDNISKKTFQNLQQYLTTIQLNPSLFNSMKPPLCAMTITIMEMQRLGFDAQYGLDRYFNRKARNEGKKTDALETIEFQVKLFFDQSPSQQELFLKQTLTEMKELKSIMQKMEIAWVTGNTIHLSSLLLESFTNFPEFYEQLLLQRNRNWIPKIKQLHAQNRSSLIIIGAAHLVGKGSVIELLTNQGYKLEQL